MSEPPTPKYELTLIVSGNSHEEIERELLGMTRGGYLLDSDHHKRDTFHVIGGRRTSILEHTNPEMTPERYDAELDAWWTERKAEHMTTPPAPESATPFPVVAEAPGMATMSNSPESASEAERGDEA